MKNKYFTENERYQLEVLYRQGYKPKDIAPILDKSLATIYNELKRGMTVQIDSDLREYETYFADVAQRKYEYNCTNKGADLKLQNDYDFVKYVEDKIKNEKYSPYAVLQEIKNGDMQFKTNVCKTTLYNYIRNGLFMGLTMQDLPMPRKSQGKGKIGRRTARNNIKGRSIETRPKEVNDREEYGHWEMDTVVCGMGKSGALLVLTERCTRQEYIFKLASKTLDEVSRKLDRLEIALGTDEFKNRFKTITCDNGCEFLDFNKLEKSVQSNELRTTIYYCHPYCSSERGSNENHNRMIRRWIPKGSDISQYSNEEIEQIQEWMNNYPRELFGGMSSNSYRQSQNIS